MKNLIKFFLLLTILFAPFVVSAQKKPTTAVLTGAELTRTVPTGFYFEGQSAPTQMRNAAAIRLGENRHVIAGLVDTSGYSTEIRAKYEGFLITDSEIKIGGSTLAVGAYGFGFTDDNKLNIFDVAGNEVLVAETTNDKVLKRPRPLMMMKSGDEFRLYAGRSFAVISGN